jgi:GNAT superfamily N-acetyltransferase
MLSPRRRNTGAMTFTIRRAVVSDAEAMTSIHFQAWRETYTGMVPESVFEARESRREERLAVWREIIEGRSPFGNERAFVAEMDGQVVGWATASDGRDEDSPYPNELDGLYVLAEAHGTGCGSALLEAAVGSGSGAFVWALDGVTRARSFYRKMGFEPDGAVKEFQTDGASLPEARLVRHPR